MENSFIPPQRDRSANGLAGSLRPAQLRGDDAQQVQRIGIVRIDGQKLAANLLGVCQPPRLLVLNGNREGCGGRGHEFSCLNASSNLAGVGQVGILGFGERPQFVAEDEDIRRRFDAEAYLVARDADNGQYYRIA